MNILQQREHRLAIQQRAGLGPQVLGAPRRRRTVRTWAGWTDQIIKTGFPSDVQDSVKEYMAPVVQMISGIANTVLSLVYEVENGNSGTAIAASVLGNMSFIFAWANAVWMKAATDDVSCLIKMAIDLSGNLGATICIAESSTLPVPD